jgi:hypothetical protein
MEKEAHMFERSEFMRFPSPPSWLRAPLQGAASLRAANSPRHGRVPAPKEHKASFVAFI